MPKFTDAENKTYILLPEGDYKYMVTDWEIGISTGPATAGSEKYTAKFTLIDHPGSELRETLIDHPKTGWKIDTFLKSAGIKPGKDEDFAFKPNEQSKCDPETGLLWINPIGLRGWCKLIQEDYVTKAKTTIKINKVSIFYTDKEKLPQIISEEEMPF